MKKEFMGVSAPKNPNTLEKGLKDRNPAGKKPEKEEGSPEFSDVGIENIDEETERLKTFEEKYKENHQIEFRTPEGLTADQVYDPTDELDAKIDKEKAKEMKGYGLSSITGPEKYVDPKIAALKEKRQFIPKDVWDKMPSWKRKKFYEARKGSFQDAVNQLYMAKKKIGEKIRHPFKKTDKKEAA